MGIVRSAAIAAAVSATADFSMAGVFDNAEAVWVKGSAKGPVNFGGGFISDDRPMTLKVEGEGAWKVRVNGTTVAATTGETGTVYTYTVDEAKGWNTFGVESAGGKNPFIRAELFNADGKSITYTSADGKKLKPALVDAPADGKYVVPAGKKDAPELVAVNVAEPKTCVEVKEVLVSAPFDPGAMGYHDLYRAVPGKRLDFRLAAAKRGFVKFGVYCTKPGKLLADFGDGTAREWDCAKEGGLDFESISPSRVRTLTVQALSGEFDITDAECFSFEKPSEKAAASAASAVAAAVGAGELPVAEMQAICQKLVDQAVADGVQAGVQFCVYKDGRRIVDVWAGRLARDKDSAPVTGDTLFPIFSTGKTLLSTAVHRAVEQGKMDYGKPLCAWWPEFTGKGKEKLTLRETLGYRSGMNGGVPKGLTDRDMADWEKTVAAAAAEDPEIEPGTVQRYMPYSYAWMLGHPLEVAMGKPLNEALRELVLIPAGIENDFEFASPESSFPRLAEFSYSGGFCEIMNNDWARKSCLPSAWSASSARGLAKFYNRLCGFDGEAPLLKKETLDEALKPCRWEGDPLPNAKRLNDKWYMLFGMGYGLWGEYGRMDRVFGHGGAGGSEALVDRDNRLIVAYTCNYGRNSIKLRTRLYSVVGMKWRYWKDEADIQTLQMRTAGR